MTETLALAFPYRYFVELPTTSFLKFLPTFSWEVDILPLLLDPRDFKEFRAVCKKFYLASLCFTMDPLFLLHWDSPVFVVSWQAKSRRGVLCLCPLFSSCNTSLFIASSGSDKDSGMIWSVNVAPDITSTLIQTLPGHTDIINSICALPPDGPTTHVITTSWDKTLKIWSTEDPSSGWKCVGTLQGHTDAVSWVCVVPQGERDASDPASPLTNEDDLVVSASWDGTLKMWDWKTKTCIITMQGHTRGVCCVIPFGGFHKILSGSEDNTIKLWEYSFTSASRVVKTYTGHSYSVACLCSFDNQHFVSGSYDKTVKLWHVDQLTPICTLKGHTEPVWGVKILTDHRPSSPWQYKERKLILSCSLDKTIRVWIMENYEDLSAGGECVTVLDVGVEVWSLEVLENRFIVCGDQTGKISMWDVGFPARKKS